MSKRQYRKKGRGGGGRFVKLDEWLQRTPAWRSLDPTPRCVLIELMRLYNGENNGHIGLSCRQASELVGVSKSTAADAIQKLLERGFIRITNHASFGWKTGARQRISATYALTHLPVGDALATKDFLRWGETDNVIRLPVKAAARR